jgi:Concanavalin A-like lectin/glucanases superfamily/Bacterial Ig domain
MNIQFLHDSRSPLTMAFAVAIAAMFSTSIASAQSAGLVAAYSFDEGTGTTAADSSGNGNSGTLINGATWSTTAKFGAAASFDGSNDRIDVADSNTLDLTSGMTLEAWVRPTANSSYRTVVLKEVPGELAYSLYAADSDHGALPSGWVRVGSVSHFAAGTGSLPLNVYSHIAVTYNGTALVYYVNGVATGSTAVSGNIQTSSLPLRIGSNTIWGEYFQGQIDEVRVYNRALSQSEIQSDMVIPIGGSPAPDTIAPTVSLTAPLNGATLAGIATFSATAADNVAVAAVQFKVDGIFYQEDATAPYTVQWNAATAASGSHQITAIARDAAGNTTTSAAVNVTVTGTSPDGQAPTVSLTAPAGGATISGTTTLSADAADNIGVVGVQFKVDGANLGAEDTSAPYSASWNSVTASNGTHSLTAVARDAAGNTTTSASRTVTVTNTSGDSQAPAVSLTAPANGARVSGSLSISANASDNVGVAGVQFKVDGVNFGTEDTGSPYGRTWNASTAASGTHSLTAVARDAAGNTTTSAVVSVTVDNSDAIPPTVSFTSPASGATVSGAVTVAANAADNVAVVGVQFRLDGNALSAEDLTAPYSVSWTTAASGNGTHVLTAIARDAAGQTATATRTVTVSNAAGAALTIDGNRRFQTIDGFGVSANSGSWNNGELKPALDKLADEGGSTIWRVVIEMADWEATNDDANPANFNWTYYNTIYSSPRFEELWATLAYLNQKGITSNLMLNFMGRGPTWLGGADLPSAMEDEWVETVVSVAYYARNNRHIQFGMFAPNNESDWDGIEGIRMSSAQNTRVMHKLAVRLDALGLGDIRLVGPDTADIFKGVGDYMPSLMGDSTVMAKMDHFSFHDYAGNSGGADSAIKNSAYPGRNFWITEVSNVWDALSHMSQGPAAILVWDGYDSVYNHAILAGRGSSPPNDVGNGPALLAYSTSTHLYTARTAFYEFAQLFRFVPAGSVRIAADESNGNVTLFAFLHPVTGRVTIVGRNSSGSNFTFAGRLSNLPVVPSFEFYTTTSSANMQRGTDVTVSGGAFSFTAPGNSVFTLTYAGPADTVPPTVSVTAPLASATVGGNVTVTSATATDNVGIRGVQFRLDGALLGVEDTTAPYSVQWSTAGVANGAHSLVAVARDWSGNVTTSAATVVTVSN